MMLAEGVSTHYTHIHILHLNLQLILTEKLNIYLTYLTTL
jgi:hypothetical protein